MANDSVTKIYCPDCGQELDEVSVERFQTKTFKVDYANQKLVPAYPEMDWEQNDVAIHCPNCDTLNTDELFTKFSLEEG